MASIAENLSGEGKVSETPLQGKRAADDQAESPATASKKNKVGGREGWRDCVPAHLVT